MRWLAYGLATTLIVLALFVGLVRLLLPLAPEYREQIRSVAAQTTGFEVVFDGISASWPLRGPELKLLQVRLVDPADGADVLAADEVAIGVSVFRMIRERVLTPSRIRVIGTRVSVELDGDGRLRVQGRLLEELLRFRLEESGGIPDLDVRLEDLRLRYLDTGRTGQTLDAVIDQLDLGLAPEGVAVEGGLALDGDPATRLDVALDIPAELLGFGDERPDAAWGLYLEGENIRLADTARLLLAMDTPFTGGAGSATVTASFQGVRPVAVAANLRLADVTLAGVADAYPLLSVDADWQATERGWTLFAEDLRILRGDGEWDPSTLAISYRPGSETTGIALEGDVSFLRLDDLYPLVLAMATPEFRAEFMPTAVAGELRNARLVLNAAAGGEPPSYRTTARFQNVGIDLGPRGPSITGLSGSLSGDQNGGRLELDSVAVAGRLPGVFQGPLAAAELNGFLVWRVTDEGIRVLTDRFSLSNPGLRASGRFELTLVPDRLTDSLLDLDATATADDARQVLPFLPTGRFPPAVGQWLDRAIVAGRISDGSVQFRGRLGAFPFESGDGVFRAEFSGDGGILDYADGWPRIEEVSGRFVFEGLSLITETNAGRIAGIRVQDRKVRIRDLREGILEISGQQSAGFRELLALLRSLPATVSLHPVLDRVQGQGMVDGDFDLRVPIRQPRDYLLRARLTARDCSLGLAGVPFSFTDLNGPVTLDNTRLSADGLTARLLDRPVQLKLRPSAGGGDPYSHYALVTGATPAGDWARVLELPGQDRLEGIAAWRAMAMIPAPGQAEPGSELRVLVDADLRDVGVTLPTPLAKMAGDPAALSVDVSFPAEDLLDVAGRLRDDLAWALRMRRADQGWTTDTGSIVAGGGPAALPPEPGVEISGRLDTLRVDDWLAAADEATDNRWRETYRRIDLEIGQLSVFGQLFPGSAVTARRADDAWDVDVAGPNAAGRLRVPFELRGDQVLRLDMAKLWLTAQDTDLDTGTPSDPRSLVPVEAEIEDFAMGELRFGRLTTRLTPVADGVTASPIDIDGGSFTIQGDGGWLVLGGDVNRQRSRLRLELSSTDIADTLARLGYSRVIEGRAASASGDLSWPGPPTADFLERASGDLSVRMQEGSLLEVEPGGGRLLGVLSVGALPRRLALDFSDVFDEGLRFDRLQGDFTVENGDAYTCNLGLEGSVADLGIVGRAGLRDEDYDQLAVVRPHVSNIMALGGVVVGGPGVGAAMLLISQIFRKPLSALGESYYEIRGSWEDPSIDRIQRSQVDRSRFRDCERYLAAILPLPAGDTELDAEPGSELPPEIVP